MTSLIKQSVYGKLDVLKIVNRKLPPDMRMYIQKFLINECKYAEYDMNYTWEEVEGMLNDALPWGPDFCCHLFKIFDKMGDGLQLFYPNAKTDPEVKLLRKQYYLENHDYYDYGISFDKYEWFNTDYIKMPGRRKRWYYDDNATNYEAMATMITTVLRKFDEWYWDNYSGTGVDHDLLTHIIKVYDTLEKYAHMDDEEFERDDNSIEYIEPYH